MEDILRENSVPGGIIQNKLNPVGRYERSIPNPTSKTYTLSIAQFQMILYATYSFQEWNIQGKF